MADILVDTDIFIDHLRGSAELKPGRNRLHYSVVTSAELIAGNSATDLVSQVLAPFRELTVDRSLASVLAESYESSSSGCPMHSSQRQPSRTASP